MEKSLFPLAGSKQKTADLKVEKITLNCLSVMMVCNYSEYTVSGTKS